MRIKMETIKQIARHHFESDRAADPTQPITSAMPVGYATGSSSIKDDLDLLGVSSDDETRLDVERRVIAEYRRLADAAVEDALPERIDEGSTGSSDPHA